MENQLTQLKTQVASLQEQVNSLANLSLLRHDAFLSWTNTNKAQIASLQEQVNSSANLCLLRNDGFESWTNTNEERMARMEASLNEKMSQIQETITEKMNFDATAFAPKVEQLLNLQTKTIKSQIETWTDGLQERNNTVMDKVAKFEESVLTAVRKVEEQLESFKNLKIESIEKLLDTFEKKMQGLEELKKESEAMLVAGCSLAFVLAGLKPTTALTGPLGVHWFNERWEIIKFGSSAAYSFLGGNNPAVHSHPVHIVQ